MFTLCKCVSERASEGIESQMMEKCGWKNTRPLCSSGMWVLAALCFVPGVPTLCSSYLLWRWSGMFQHVSLCDSLCKLISQYQRGFNHLMPAVRMDLSFRKSALRSFPSPDAMPCSEWEESFRLFVDLGEANWKNGNVRHLPVTLSQIPDWHLHISRHSIP